MKQRSCIFTWGIFDGVHRGHKRLIHQVVRWAKKVNAVPLVITFQEHPEKVLRKNGPLFLTSLEHRQLLLKREGIKIVKVLPFNRRISSLSPEDFIRRVVLKFNPYGIVISRETRFGRNRSGDAKLLRALGRKYGIRIRTIPPLKSGGKVISSTRIRKAISKDNLQEVSRLLGRSFSLLGTVGHGSGRGARLGIPTANLDLHHEAFPQPGVYAGYTVINNKRYNALTNVGIRPTFNQFHSRTVPIVVEVHIINYEPKNLGSLYGKNLEVILLKRLRSERRFKNSAELVRQIERDKKYFLDNAKLFR